MIFENNGINKNYACTFSRSFVNVIIKSPDINYNHDVVGTRWIDYVVFFHVCLQWPKLATYASFLTLIAL